MAFTKRKLLTIICEAQLEASLVDDIHAMKIRGYTIYEARGEGSRGLRAADWEANRNIRIEIVCSESDAVKLMEHLKAEYYENYAMISYIADVEVLRGDKFS